MFGDYCFEVVSSFPYLSSTVSEDLHENEEIRRIAARNRAYFALNKILKSKLGSQSTKFRLFFRALDHSGLWTFTTLPVELLDRFEITLVRIIGPTTYGIRWQRKK